MLPASPRQLFRFCQLDFSFPLGPADGRYLARAGDEDLDVIIFKSVDAPRRSVTRSRRPKRVEQDTVDPDPVSTSRVTVIDSIGFEDETAAEDWLVGCRKDELERDEATAAALRVVNRAVHAHRIAAADPYARELTRAHAHTVRLGYGVGDEVVDGHWRSAYELPPPRPREGRRQMLAPQEQLAAILSGRRPVFASEDLLLRARLDVEQSRPREAALGLRMALDVLEAELTDTDLTDAEGKSTAAESLEWVRRRAGEIRDLAEAALSGELDDGRVLKLNELLAEIERLFRRRRHLG